MRFVGRVLSFFVLISLGVLSTSAQQNEPQVPTFSSQTNLVLVPVQVRNKGQHMSGLKKEDFVLTQDGHEQKVAFFEEVRTTTERFQRAKAGANQFTNEIVGSPETARYTIIAIDTVNTRTLDMHRVYDGLLKFLAKAVDNGEPIRIVAIDLKGIRVIQDFTTDPKALASALQGSKMANKASGPANATISEIREMSLEADAELSAATTEEQQARMSSFLQTLSNNQIQQERFIAFQQRNARISALEALQQLALSLSGLPGRKSVVWVSSGFPFTSMARESSSTIMTSQGLAAGGHAVRDFGSVLEATALDEYTTHVLSSANVAMYPVSASGTVNPMEAAFDPSQKYSPTAAQKEALLDSNQDVKTMFQRLALGTGGKACLERTDISGCFQDALDDSKEYYILGFYVDRQNTKNGWHKLQVKVDKDANVRARTGYLYPIPDPAARRDRDLTVAMTSLLTDTGVPFKGEWAATEPKGDKRIAKFSIQVDPRARVIDPQSNRLNLEFAGVARAKDGSIVGKFAQKVDRTLPPEAVSTIQNQGIAYKNAFELPPGEYLVRFVIRDNNTGHMGTASSLLTVK